MAQFGFEIHRLSKMIQRSRVHSAVQQHVDCVTGTHGYLLHYLYDNRGRDVFQRDIEKQFSIGRSTVTSILQLMEKNGLILRESVPQDARLKRIILTQEALDLHVQIEQDIADFETKLTKGLTNEERIAFLTAVKKMRQNMTELEK